MTVLQVPGMDKESLFNRTAEWAATYLKTENADAKSGIILAKGEVCYPTHNKDRGQHTIVFTMEIIIGDKRNEVRFSDIMLKFPVQYISEAYTVQDYKDYKYIPLVSKSDIEATKVVLQHIVDQLANYLKGAAGHLSGFPACGT